MEHELYRIDTLDHNFTLRDVSEMSVLRKELSKTAPDLTYDCVYRTLGSVANEQGYVVVARESVESTIVGMGMLLIYQKWERYLGVVEDVIVTKKWRRQGIARAINLELIEIGRAEGLYSISLTSRPAREEARALYRSLGYVEPETTLFRLKL